MGCLEGQVDNGRGDDNQAKDSSKRIDSTNQLIKPPHQEGHVCKHTKYVFGSSFRVQDVQSDSKDYEHPQGDVWPLGHGQASSPPTQQRPANSAKDDTRFPIW